MKYIFIFLLFVFIHKIGYASRNLNGDSTINQKDSYGRKQGKWIYYYENGSIERIVLYKDDKLNGQSISYWQNGVTKRVIFFRDNKPWTILETKDSLGNVLPTGDLHEGNGTWKMYDDKGILVIEDTFIDGVIKGLSKTYYSNGKMGSEGVLVDFQIPQKVDSVIVNGETVVYLESVPPKKIGLWRSYSKDGKIIKDEIYDSQGNILQTINY